MTIDRIKEIERAFISHFERVGYALHESEPLIPRNDPTLSFTNATIVALKPHLRENFAAPGFVLVQPCLRLRNLAQDSFDGQFTSFFRMVSILAHPSVDLTTLKEQITTCFTQALKLSPERIRIHYDARTAHLASNWEGIVTVKDAHSESYYSWNFGLAGVSGKGITFCVITPNGERELGNFVELYRGDSIIGYEFGFGLESCLCILDALPNNFSVLFGKNSERKLSDLAAAAISIHYALLLHTGPLPQATRSAAKKIFHELTYALLQAGDRNCQRLYAIDWSTLGIPQDAVVSALKYVEGKIAHTNQSGIHLVAYRAYVATMRLQGKSEEWCIRKLEEYVRKNNLGRISGLIDSKPL